MSFLTFHPVVNCVCQRNFLLWENNLPLSPELTVHAPLTQVPVPVFLPAPLDSSQPSAAAEQKSKSPSDPLDADLLAMTDLVTEDEGKTEATSVNSEPPHGPRASVCACGLACVCGRARSRPVTVSQLVGRGGHTGQVGPTVPDQVPSASSRNWYRPYFNGYRIRLVKSALTVLVLMDQLGYKTNL